ncbi:MAG: hypothetical protein M3552_16285 [Planctomycetota bacterium]|nr:hypothetical protein [Planctomycetota bacterium]
MTGVSSLPTSVIVGEMELCETRSTLSADAAEACASPEPLADPFGWWFERPNRFEEPLQVRFLPYGIWFYLFRRRNRELPAAVDRFQSPPFTDIISCRRFRWKEHHHVIGAETAT